MIHEEYRLSDEKIVEQNKRMFDWSQRPIQKFELPGIAKEILLDARLNHYYSAMKDWARRFAIEQGEELEKVEVIIGKWELDENYSSVFMRLTSSHGIFMLELATKTMVQTQYLLVEIPATNQISAA